MSRTVGLIESDGAVRLDLDAPESNSHAVTALLRAAKGGLNNLTTRQRQALEMYYIEGLTQCQIADIWGVDKSAVCRHLARARRRVQQLVVAM